MRWLLQVVRGKKTKAAKAKAKYAGQDAEDRELAMQFLASAGAPSPLLLLFLLCFSMPSGSSCEVLCITACISVFDQECMRGRLRRPSSECMRPTSIL